MELYSSVAASSSSSRVGSHSLCRDASFSDQSHLQFYGPQSAFLPPRRRFVALPLPQRCPLLQDRLIISSSSFPSPSSPLPCCAGASSCSNSCAEAFATNSSPSAADALTSCSSSAAEPASSQQELMKELAGLKMQMKQKKKELKAKLKESKKAMKGEGKHKKQEKKKKKAMMDGGSSSSSESSDSECGEGVDMRMWRKQQENARSGERVTGTGPEIQRQAQVPDMATVAMKEAGCAVMQRFGGAVAQGGTVGVCVGGKCKRAGSEQLLAALRSQIPDSSSAEAVPCKCMGRCAMAINVRVQKHSDGAEQQQYHSHSGAGDAHIILSHHFGIGEGAMGSSASPSPPRSLPPPPPLPSLAISLPA